MWNSIQMRCPGGSWRPARVLYDGREEVGEQKDFRHPVRLGGSFPSFLRRQESTLFPVILVLDTRIQDIKTTPIPGGGLVLLAAKVPKTAEST